MKVKNPVITNQPLTQKKLPYKSNLLQQDVTFSHYIKQRLSVIKIAQANLKRMFDMNILTAEIFNKKSSIIDAQIEEIIDMLNDTIKPKKEPNIHKETFNLQKIVSDTAYLFRNITDIEITENFAGIDITELRVLGSKKKLEHALLNLIVNSYHALDLKEKDRKINISLSCSKYNSTSMATLSIADNALGMPESWINKCMTTPYSSTRHSRGGSGIGIISAKQIIEEMGGTMKISSSNEGTVVTFLLPLSDSSF